MQTTNEIDIVGDPALLLPRIFQLAADIQDWPAILPHYRYMRILESSELHKVAKFGARRDFVPVSWTARQDLFPGDKRITFQHTGGVTRGMWVEWRMVDRGDHVHVTIEHRLTYPVPVLGPLFARYIVGRLFVENIAGKTLRCFKTITETELPSVRSR